MSAAFEQIDSSTTPLGVLGLRRRLHPSLGIDVYEVKIDDEHLMSSLFTAAEIALGTLALEALDAAVIGNGALDVVVGGLGLGYTAGAVLDDDRVGAVHVVEYLEPVIDWHERRLLPLSPQLADDARCHFVPGDFFALVAGGGFGPTVPPQVHVIALDIDHTPRHVLSPTHAPFYEADGLRRLHERLHVGGVYALWSDDPPDDAYLAVLDEVFATADSHVVAFPNPLTGEEAFNTVYVATRE